MAAIELREGRTPGGAGKAAQAVNKREQDTIVGRVREVWRRLTRPGSGTDQALPRRVPPERPSAAKAPERGEPSPGPPVKESAGKSTKPPSSGKERFRLLTLDELDVLPDPEWLIKGILPQGGLAVLYGEPGAGKSFLALDWAMSIASERPWFGGEVKAGAAVYVYAEGASGLKFRVRAWCNVKKGKPDCMRVLPHSLNLLDREEVDELIKAIRKDEGEPNLIVIDTLARCFGNGDENAPKDMNAFVAGADALREAFPGAAVLVVHHSGKDPKRGDRGHTALRAAADTVLRLAKGKSPLTLKCDKQKDAEEFKEVLLWLRRVDVGKGKTSCVIQKTGAKSLPETADPRALKTDATALEALRQCGSEGANFVAWRKASKLKRSTFQDTRQRLVRDGLVIKMDNGRYVVAELGPGAETGPEPGCPAAA